MTAKELLTISCHERCELVKGHLQTKPLNGFEHGVIVADLGYRIDTFVRERRLGDVLGAGTGFWLSRDPDTVRAADVSFLRRERVPAAGFDEGYFKGAPDLLAEVLSPEDTAEEIDDKLNDYLTAGARLMWIVDPDRRTVTVHRHDAIPVVLRPDDTLDGGEVLPGFTMTVAEVFA